MLLITIRPPVYIPVTGGSSLRAGSTGGDQEEKEDDDDGVCNEIKMRAGSQQSI